MTPFFEPPKPPSDLHDLSFIPASKSGSPEIDPSLLEKPVSEYVSVVLELEGAASEYLEKLADREIMVDTFYDNLVQVSLPVSRLEEISKIPFVLYTRTPNAPLPTIADEGLEELKAELAHSLGFQGAGVKIAIIDLGFDIDNPAIKDSIVDSRAFSRNGNIRGSSLDDTRHGTGTAEIVHAVAPEASLLLYNVDNSISLRNALDHAVKAGAQIVSISMSWWNAGPYDGTSSVSRALDEIRAKGILPITSVGNDADGHWDGRFNDQDGDNWHDFGSSDETNTITLKAGQEVRIWLSWDDWPRSNQDYDLYLWDEANKVRVAKSTRTQSGRASPTESITYKVPTDGDYRITIWKAKATRPVFFELFVNTGILEYLDPASSVPNLSDAKGAISVGATHHRTGELEVFSSRGPTNDGRVKPDLTAPDGVTTSTYSRGFFGTSASAPHVAGVAALILGGNPDLSADDLQNLLEKGVVDAGVEGRDNQFGWGKTRASFVVIGVSEGGAGIMVDDVEYDHNQLPIGFVWSPGSRHTFEVLTTTIPLGPGSRTDFQRWIDLTGETLTINPFIGLTYQGGPSAFNAEFENQFLLSVESIYGLPEGSGWYKEDTLAFISLDSDLIDQGNKTRRRAGTWIGDTEALNLGEERAAEQSRSFSTIQTPIVLKAPATLTLEWTTEYQVSFEISDSKGAGLRGASPSMTIRDSEGIELDLTDYRNIWMVKGRYQLEAIQWKDNNIKPLDLSEFTIDASSTINNIELMTRVYDIEFRITDILGLPAVGAETRIITADGERFFQSVDSDGSVFLSQVPLEEYEVRVSSLTGTKFVTGDASEGPLEIKVALSMISLIGLFIVVVVVSVGLIFMRRRGRKSEERLNPEFMSEPSERGNDSEPQELSNPKYPI